MRTSAIRLMTIAALALPLCFSAGCTVYESAPGVFVTAPPSTFDRSWSAAVGAFEDHGVRITLRRPRSGPAARDARRHRPRRKPSHPGRRQRSRRAQYFRRDRARPDADRPRVASVRSANGALSAAGRPV